MKKIATKATKSKKPARVTGTAARRVRVLRLIVRSGERGYTRQDAMKDLGASFTRGKWIADYHYLAEKSLIRGRGERAASRWYATAAGRRAAAKAA